MDEEAVHRALLWVAGVFVLGSVMMAYKTLTTPDAPIPTYRPIDMPKNMSEHPSLDDHITIHLSGAVNRPGVYRIKSGTRALDAIKQLGGVQADADIDRVNLAAKLKDGKRLNIPRLKRNRKKRKTANTVPKNEPDTFVMFPININTSSESDLRHVPGISDTLAKRIVSKRSERGRFRNLQELLDVPGVGKSRIRQWQPYLSI